MSKYAYLVDHTTKKYLWLGKAIRGANGQLVDFHRGTAEDPPNHENELFVRAVFRFLAMNVGRQVAVVIEPEFIDDEWTVIGDMEGITFSEFLEE